MNAGAQPPPCQSRWKKALSVGQALLDGVVRLVLAEGVLRERSALPPVLQVVIYNGRRPWTTPVDVAELIASGRGAALARYQPSQRYFLLDEGRIGGADLPSGNLVSALIALETNRDRQRASELLRALIDLLRKQDDEELTAAKTGQRDRSVGRLAWGNLN